MSLGIADLKVVYKETFDARNEWRSILLHLGVSSATITSIRRELQDKSADCYCEGLAEWLKGEGRHWRDIVEALSSPTVGHKALANKIEKEHLVRETVSNGGVLSVPTQESQSILSKSQPSTTPGKTPKEEGQRMQAQAPIIVSQVTRDGPFTKKSEKERGQDNSEEAVAAVSLTAQDVLVAPSLLSGSESSRAVSTVVNDSAIPKTEAVTPASPLAAAADKRSNSCGENESDTTLSSTPILEQLPTLNSATPPVEEVIENESPARTEETVPKDLSGVLTDLDRFAGTKGEERLQFVIAGILEGVDGKSPSEIFYLLLDEHDTCEPSEAEHGQTTSATVFKEALQCAQLPPPRVEALSPFCKACTSEEESLMEKLNFRRELLELGDTIPSEALQRLVGEFTDEQLGRARGDIKTRIQLFQCLLMTRVISFERSSDSIHMLRELWQEVRDSSSPTASEIRDTGFSAATETQVSGQPNGHRVNEDDGSNESVQQKRKCSTKISVATITAILILISLCVPAGLSSYYGVLSTSSLHFPQMTIYGNNTILVAKEPLSTLFTASINFQLGIRLSSSSTIVKICQTDCTYNPPPTRSVVLDISEQSTPHQKFPSTQIKRQISFTGIDVFSYGNIYLLRGSALSFFTDRIGGPLQLYLFNKATKCSEFLLSTSNSSYQIFELSDTNDYTANFTVPSDAHDSYYCGVWVVPSNHSNITFSYTIKGSQKVYRTDQNAFCVGSLSGSTLMECTQPSSLKYCYDLPIELSFVPRSTCVFLSQTNSMGEVTTEIRTFSTFKNPAFGFPVGISILLAIVFVIVVIGIIVCCCRAKKKKSQQAGAKTI